jgi:hypothetical protein
MEPMYTISKDRDGIVLICQDCQHIERVGVFSPSLGSQRTQAARAMCEHNRTAHKKGPMLTPLPNNYGRMEQW